MERWFECSSFLKFILILIVVHLLNMQIELRLRIEKIICPILLLAATAAAASGGGDCGDGGGGVVSHIFTIVYPVF